MVIAAHIFSSILLYKIISNFLVIRKHLFFKLINLIILSLIFSVPILPSDFTNNLYTLVIWIIITIVSDHGSIFKKLSTLMIFYPMVISINLMGFLYFYNNAALRLLIFILLWLAMLKLLGNKLESAFI